MVLNIALNSASLVVEWLWTKTVDRVLVGEPLLLLMRAEFEVEGYNRLLARVHCIMDPPECLM